MDVDLMLFFIKIFIGLIIILISFLISKKIKNHKYKKIYIAINFIVMLLFAFFTSIGGWKGNIYFQFFLIEFVLGLVIFLYSIVYIIKNKKFNYFILTPIMLIVFCFLGMYYGERDELKMYAVKDKIERFYKENGNYDNKEKLFEYINVPKGMEITIAENNEIIISYKNIIYNINKKTIEYKNDN
jgi:hypothetical protein